MFSVDVDVGVASVAALALTLVLALIFFVLFDVVFDVVLFWSIVELEDVEFKLEFTDEFNADITATPIAYIDDVTVDANVDVVDVVGRINGIVVDVDVDDVDVDDVDDVDVVDVGGVDMEVDAVIPLMSTVVAVVLDGVYVIATDEFGITPSK